MPIYRRNKVEKELDILNSGEDLEGVEVNEDGSVEVAFEDEEQEDENYSDKLTLEGYD